MRTGRMTTSLPVLLVIAILIASAGYAALRLARAYFDPSSLLLFYLFRYRARRRLTFGSVASKIIRQHAADNPDRLEAIIGNIERRSTIAMLSVYQSGQDHDASDLYCRMRLDCGPSYLDLTFGERFCRTRLYLPQGQTVEDQEAGVVIVMQSLPWGLVQSYKARLSSLRLSDLLGDRFSDIEGSFSSVKHSERRTVFFFRTTPVPWTTTKAEILSSFHRTAASSPQKPQEASQAIPAV